MPKKTQKTGRLTDTPVTLRLPVELLGRIDALVPSVAADSDTATTLGGVTRSGVIRYALLEGVNVLERPHRP